MVRPRRRSLSGRRVCCAPAVVLCLSACSLAWGDAASGEIHQYCGEAFAIVIGSPHSYKGGVNGSAEILVEQWLKTPLPDIATLVVNAGPGGPEAEDKEFYLLKEKGRFLIFVFWGNRTGDGRLGSIIKIGEKGELPRSLFLRCLDPQPKTVDELAEQIRRVLSMEYQDGLVKTLGDPTQRDPVRAAAARNLGGLYARHAWAALQTQATAAGRPEEDATIRESLLALFRIGEVKTVPICLRLVHTSRYAAQVGTCAWLLSRRPSDDPTALDVLLDAANRWEQEAPNEDHPLPELIQAVTALGKKTSEVEVLVMRCVEKGTGNVLVTAMEAAGHFRLRRAVPYICQALARRDKVYDYRPSASAALAGFVADEFHPYSANRPVSEEDARQSAAAGFPEWKAAILAAPTVECFRGDRVVCASRGDKSLYVLVGWQSQVDRPIPFLKTLLLYQSEKLDK